MPGDRAALASRVAGDGDYTRGPPRRTWTRRRAPRRRPAPPRRPPAARGRAAAAPGRRSARRPRRRASKPSSRTHPARAGRGRHPLGDDRLEGGDRRARRSSSSRPSARAASGIRSPIRVIGRRRAPRHSRRPSPASPARSVGRRRTSHGRGDRAQRRVEVVERRRRHERLRAARDAPHEVRAAVRVELAETRRRAGAAAAGRRAPVSRSSSASLKARMAVRCWPREAKPARSRPASSNARSSRCGPMSVEPFQTSFSAVSTSRRASASPRRLAGPGRGVRHVAQAQPAGRGLVGRDLGVGGGQRRRPGLEQPQPRASTIAPPASRNVASQKRSSSRVARPRGSPAAGCCAAGGSARTSRGRRRRPASAAASWSMAARRSDGEPTTRSISSGANRTTRSSPPSAAPARRRR